ncbi:MAG: hypothetical protein ABL876_00305 [Chitinophagaceae bacterium]
MKKIFIPLIVLSAFISCGKKNKQNNSGVPDNKKETAQYIISKEGIGDLKIGMTQTELEKLLNQKMVMLHANDTSDIWSDTARVKYKDIAVSLYFERQYSEDKDAKVMQLMAVETSSTLCKTATGLGVGDERAAILTAYEANPIDMGPESEMVNDTTWVLSKTKYYINVKDDKWDKEIVFRLVNKKVASIEATLILGD